MDLLFIYRDFCTMVDQDYGILNHTFNQVSMILWKKPNRESGSRKEKHLDQQFPNICSLAAWLWGGEQGTNPSEQQAGAHAQLNLYERQANGTCRRSRLIPFCDRNS